MININNIDEAVQILLEQKPLVIFQNHSEWGPRALGNRSILFDPRNKDAKNIVNTFKKREWWRPLAGTILLEHVHDWFNNISS
jgi:carbamoyltransferase